MASDSFDDYYSTSTGTVNINKIDKRLDDKMVKLAKKKGQKTTIINGKNML